ncbi:MAG: bifunctional phosphoribosylaminoimidazolecarboxamide formyltransferase/IMP cyclohydrolase [Elusimicrobia bacterium]|nr:bifunctional phosphoribosylaminoimidazolecarboxamide formyltransferase/IMP cyclohydrolase [Elusimicrobiota bacterium]
MTRIAVFASGEGTNFQVLVDAVRSGWIPGEIVLLVCNRSEAGVLKRAKAAGIESVVAVGCEQMVRACRDRQVDLICLAGFLLKVEPALIMAYPNRIFNVHPALLPGFGGRGMYGRRVHEAVIRSGVKVSGCTIHFVDEDYDHGPIVLQATVPVLAEDTSESLAQRVQEQEHWLYPQAVRLFCQERLKVKGQQVQILPEKNGEVTVRRALLSVFDKQGLVEFAKGLQKMGVEIISTSGTARILKKSGLVVRPLSSITNFPEILGGRVKTLHPKIHGGILARRKDSQQCQEAMRHGIEPIDLVAVNLYPFAETAAKARSAWEPEVIEQIDVGGPSIIRAAAKNFEDVAVVTAPEDYPIVLAELEHSGGRLSLETKRRLARAAFQHTANYDAFISHALTENRVESRGTFPDKLNLELVKSQDLRYGENPHQRGCVYRFADAAPSFEQLQGKELSYNNLLDAEGAWEMVSEFEEPAAVIFKHVTPCGVGTGSNILEAWRNAWNADPISAFGGVMAVNRAFTADLAEKLSQHFMEVMVAPAFESEAVEVLRKKSNLRLLIRKAPASQRWAVRSLGEEVLVQEPDREILRKSDLRIVTRRKPTSEEEQALWFAWVCAKHVRSNAIVMSAAGRVTGIGAGQMSRVDSVRMAGQKMAYWLKSNPKPEVLVLASDAFFPFRDGLDEAAGLGVTAVIQPGGSVRDSEVIQAADEHNMAMVFTGMRHFRH